MTEPVESADADAAASEPTPGPRRRRVTLSFPALAIVFLATIVGAFGGGIYIFYGYVVYERVAARHLPPGMVGAVRVHVEKGPVYEPVRANLFPVLDAVAGAPGEHPRRDLIKEHTRLDVGLYMREVVVAQGATPGDWVVVVGGKFPRGNVVGGFQKVFDAEPAGKGRWKLVPAPGVGASGDAILVGPGGVALAQAKDASVIVASSRKLLEGALPPSQRYETLGLTLDGAGSAAGDLGRLASRFPVPLGSLVVQTGSVGRARAEMTLNSEIQVAATLTTPPGKAAAMAQTIRDQLPLAGATAEVAGQDPSGVLRVISRAQVATEGDRTVRLTFEYPRGALNELAAYVADHVQGAHGLRPRPRPTARATK